MKYVIFAITFVLFKSAFAAAPYIGTWKGYCLPSITKHTSSIGWYKFSSETAFSTYTENFKDVRCMELDKRTDEVKMTGEIRPVKESFVFVFTDKDDKGTPAKVKALLRFNQDLMHMTFTSYELNGKMEPTNLEFYFTKDK